MLIGGPSYWFHAIGGLPPSRPALPGSIEVDVAIVGAGLTGLWTAYELKRADPALRIAIVERQVAGYGASGRNGGWLCGTLAGASDERSRRAIQETVVEIGRVCKAEGIEADYVHSGALTVATTPVQLAHLRRDPLHDGDRWLVPDELAARVRVAGALGAVFRPHFARAQPAALSVGLARVVERMGVAIYEDTAAVAIEPGRVRTVRGDVRARWVVRATEGYTDSLEGLARRLAPIRSTMVVTEPLSADAWDEIGWTANELVDDCANTFVYIQRTADGRIALGGRAKPIYFRSRTDSFGEVEGWAIERNTTRLHELFPAARGAAIAHAWSGVIGAPRDWTLGVSADPATGMASAGGYVGMGFAATNLAGRILSDLIRGERSDLTTLPFVNRRPARRWEPEPFRYIGAGVVYALMRQAERNETRTGKASSLARLAYALSGWNRH
jgi:glycine/D-amino acid oxidase-like deaminating enzyme